MLVRSSILRLTLLLALGLPIALTQAAADVPESASGSGGLAEDGPVVEARLLVNAESVMPGEVVEAGVFFEIEDDWHMYWRNPGDSGLPTKLEWTVRGADVGPLRWPAPHAFMEADGALTTHAYGESVFLQNDLLITASIGERLDVSVEVDFLVCKEICIPGSVSLRRSLPVVERSQSAESEIRSLFADWNELVPVRPSELGLSVDELYSQDAIRPGDAFTAAIALVCEETEEGASPCRGLRPYRGAIEDRFIPDEMPSMDIEVTGSRIHPFADGALITLRGLALEDDVTGEEHLVGVARVENAAGEVLLVEIELPLPRAEQGSEIVAIQNPWLEPEPEAPLEGAGGLWQAFLLAFLGGLILNLMPCVLPVLAIKVFGIAERAHSQRSDLLKNGAAYTVGILVTMSLLAAVVIGLRAAGTSVGWGFQFQEPLFVAAISVLLLAFALNLFGLFELGVPGARWMQAGAGGEGSGLRASFFEGLLAVLLATPCTAPFLGTAVGFAFASPAPVILAIFLAIGLGLAAPFVAITLVPGWARLLPRSGAWMLQLRAVLGFALLATLVWLLWIVGQQVGTNGMTLLLGFLLCLALGIWIYGIRQRASAEGRAPKTALVLIALTVIGMIWLPLAPLPAPSSSEKEQGAIGAAARFDPAAVAQEVATGRPAFVYFTADWCLTCKLNERMVLSDERIQQALEESNSAVFKADWTLRDEGIRAELARFGRAGVPLYLLYDPAQPGKPQVLPELLSVDLVLEALSGLDKPTR
ncbi:MAG: thioredoxin family protein [Myxococcota bacterium]|nr:thioredoxin family protein [Myxococcota bacterium]